MCILNHLYCSKNVTFLTWNTCVRTAPVQEVGVFLKWNLKEFGQEFLLCIKLNTFDDWILFSELASYKNMRNCDLNWS